MIRWVCIFLLLLGSSTFCDDLQEEKDASYRSIWKTNAGKRIWALSEEYATSFEFPASGNPREAVEISVLVRQPEPRVIYFGRVEPRATEYGVIQFELSPLPGSMPHLTAEVPNSSPPPFEERRGKFLVEISYTGVIRARPYDNYGVPAFQRERSAELQLDGNLLKPLRPLLDLYGADGAWRLVAGIEHTGRLSVCDFILGAERLIEQRRKFLE